MKLLVMVSVIHFILLYCVLFINNCYASNTANTFKSSDEDANPESQGSLATLEFVALVSRHGSRAPAYTYPYDPYPCNDTRFWPNGCKQLTNVGKQQMYQIGKILRERYPGFLSQFYHPDDILVEYDNITRDFMSAACLVAALYPPAGDDVWNQDLLWQPVLLNIRAFDVCSIRDTCPSFKAESNSLVDKINKKMRNEPNIMKILKELTYYTGSNLSSINDLDNLHDLLVMQEQNGYKLPHWTNQFFPEPLASLAAPNLLTQFGGSDFLTRMSAGPELKYISDLLNMKVNGTYESSRKFYIETAHDCTLASILIAFGNKDPHLMIYTSAYIVFELHYLPDIYIIETRYFKNSTDLIGEYIDITGCPNPCSLENFTKFVDNLNPPNWKQLCQEKPHRESLQSNRYRIIDTNLS